MTKKLSLTESDLSSDRASLIAATYNKMLNAGKKEQQVENKVANLSVGI